MGASFSAIFSFITMMFNALERFASAFFHLSVWADEAAGTFEDEARHKRQERIKELLKEANLTALPKAAGKTKDVASA